jgi:hypothetical protein
MSNDVSCKNHNESSISFEFRHIIQGQKYQSDVLRKVITLCDRTVVRQHCVTVSVRAAECSVGAACHADGDRPAVLVILYTFQLRREAF